ncbi:MAG: CRISPR-associated endonuclease Cas1 [Methylohalobius sp.]|nr:CRISPR-associated endonuclease Cas1 [Methylohalobius sp.]
MPAVYLNASQVRRVNLEGPALKVICRNQSEQYFPLTRISRVVSIGPVTWSSAALMECLRWRVPITWLDRGGRLVGMCIGAWAQESKFNALLDAFFTLEDGPQRLKDWFHGSGRKRLLVLLKKHGLRLPDLRMPMVREYLTLELKRRQIAVEPTLFRRLYPLTLAHTAEILTAYQVQPAILEPSHEWRGLTAYLAGLLEWEWWELALSKRLETSHVLDERAVVACYERHAELIKSQAQYWVGRLWHWLEQSEAYSA